MTQGTEPPTPNHWEQLEAAFAELQGLAIAQRGPRLADIRKESPRLAQEVEELLESFSEGDQRFENPEISSDLLPETSTKDDLLGKDLGPFRVASLLGRGGMGEVYLAQRREGFEQQVAIKVLRSSMTGTVFAQRFFQERETLARLSHPHIAGLVDGGASAEGIPWLAMEYVPGLTLLDYCRNRELSDRDMVGLVIDVAEAVQFAHQQFVVHRDLKPGNILVREDGHPVLLDFGIAKLLKEEEASAELGLTLPQMPIYTPEYASPEQMRGERVGVSSDVYSLGVILFQLLSRQLPFSTEGRTRFEMTVLVSEREAPHLRTLSSKLSPDLDAIVHKCLRKDPQERYATVQALHDDLGRWLRALPVHAQPDSWWYRSRRFLQRHRVVVSLIAILLASGSIGFQAWYQQSQLTAQKGLTASRVSAFLVDFFSRPDPWARGLADMSMADFFESDLQALFEELEQEPEVQRKLAAALGRVLLNLGEEERAMEILDLAIHALPGAAKEDPLGHANLLFDFGVAARRAGQLDLAEKSLQQVLQLRRDELGEKNEEVASAWNTLGLVHYTKGNIEEATREYQKALEIREALHGKQGLPLASTLNNLGAAALAQGDHVGAVEYFSRAKKIHELAYQDQEHPDWATTLNNLGMAYQFMNDLDQAEELFQESFAMRQRILPPDHPYLAGSLNNLGLIEEERGRYPQAAALFEQALSLAQAKAPAGHPLLERIQENLSAVEESR